MDKIKAKLEGRVLPIVLFTVFIDLLGVGILIPIIPQLLANPHSNFYLLPSGWSYKDGLILLGFLTAIFPFMQFIATPILGQLSDRYGRKKLLAVSLAGTSASYALFAYAILTRNIPLLFFSRGLDGITGGNVAVAQAAIADVTAPEHRTRNFGLMGAIFGLGFILGPYIGGKLATPSVTLLHIGSLRLFTTPHWFNAATPFWFAAILAGLNTMMVLINFPETLKNVQHHLKIQWSKSVHNIIKAATLPGLRDIFPTVFFFWGGFSFFTTFFAVYLTSKLGFKTNNVGDFFAYIGLWIAITQGVLTAILAKKFANYRILRFSIIGLAFALLLVFIPNNTTQLLIVTPFIPIMVGLSIANVTALVSRSAPADIQGEVLGINASVQALAQSIPAALTGFLGGINRNVPVIAASITVAFGGYLFWFLYKPTRETSQLDPTEPVIAH